MRKGHTWEIGVLQNDFTGSPRDRSRTPITTKVCITNTWWGHRAKRASGRVGSPARWLRSLARGLSESTVLTRLQATVDRILRRFDLAANSSRARQPCPGPQLTPSLNYGRSNDLRVLSKFCRYHSLITLRIDNVSQFFPSLFPECRWTQ